MNESDCCKSHITTVEIDREEGTINKNKAEMQQLGSFCNFEECWYTVVGPYIQGAKLIFKKVLYGSETWAVRKE